MNRFAITLCLIAFAGFSSGTVAADARQREAGSVEAKIRAVLRVQQDAWNHGNIDSFMKGYARSATTAFVSEDKITRGWETVRDRYRKKYSDRAKMGQLTFSDLEITPLSKDSAIAIGTWRLKREEDEPHGRFTLIFRLTNDGWRIVYDHTSAAEEVQ